MSLINQMLQDLARRQAPPGDVPGQISPLAAPPPRKPVPVWIWIILMALINIATVTWFNWPVHRRATAPATMPAEPGKKARTPAQAEPAKSAQSAAPAAAAPTTITPAQPPLRPPVAQNPPAATPLVPANRPAMQANDAPQPQQASNLAQPAGTVAASQTDNPASPASALPNPVTPSPEPPRPGSRGPATPHATPEESTITIRKQSKPFTPEQLAQNDYLQAYSVAQQGDMAAAIAGFTQALTLDPHHHQARLMLAGLLIESKRYAEAEHLLQAGLASDPGQVDFAMLLARLQVEHDSVDASIATLMRSLPFAVNQADYQAFLAALLQRAGRNEEAIAHYVAALKQNPQSGLWWMGLGISEKAAKHPADAREAFTRAKAAHNLRPELEAFVDQQLQ